MTDRICFCVAPHLRAPLGFDKFWSHYPEIGNNAAELPAAVKQAKHMVILVDAQESQQAAVLRFIRPLLDMGMEMPMTFVAPLTSQAEAEQPDAVGLETGLAKMLLKSGVDGVIAGEPCGFGFVLALRAEFQQAAMLCDAFNNTLHQRQVLEWKAMQTMRRSHHLMWEYPRMRNYSMIPEVSHNLGSGEITTIDGFSVGGRMVTGENGKIFVLTRQVAPDADQQQDGADGADGAGEGVAGGDLPVAVVAEADRAPGDPPEREDEFQAPGTRRHIVSDKGLLLTFEKSSFRSLRDLRIVRMHRMLGSSQWTHPNLTPLRAVYQSLSHLMFQFEYGGSETLYRRMMARQDRPISLKKVVAIIKQTIDVVCFLHQGPRVAHLNIKPENLIVRETDDNITLTLLGFDFAAAQPEGHKCHRCKGCVPFVAPEVLSMGSYCGFSADVWSLGVMVVEFLCGIHTMERLMGWRQPQDGQHAAGPRGLQARMTAAFEPLDAVLGLVRDHCQEDLRVLLPKVVPLIEGALQVDVSKRWSSQYVFDFTMSLEVPDDRERFCESKTEVT